MNDVTKELGKTPTFVYPDYLPSENPDINASKRVQILNGVGRDLLMQNGFFRYLESGNASELTSEARERLNEYDLQIEQLTREHGSPQGPSLTEAGVEQEQWKALVDQRRKSGGKRIVVFDFDKTITAGHDGIIDPRLLGSWDLDPYIGANREHFRAVVATAWGPLMKEFPEVFQEAGKEVPLKEGMQELLEELLKDENDGSVEVAVITTNFQPLMESWLGRIRGGQKILDRHNLFSISPTDVRASEKGSLIRKIAQDPANQGSVLEFVGDGTSDLPALDASDVVVAYHAVADERLDKTMTEHNIPHFSFKNGQELLTNLDLVPHQETP